MLAKGYVLLGSALIAYYGAATYLGWELGSPQRHVVPADARQAGWARSPHFWHSGYRGGK